MQPEDHAPVGIIGAGIVGGSLLRFLTGTARDVRVFDPPRGHDRVQALDSASVVFVCVPTPYTPGRGFDDRFLVEAIAGIRGGKTVVIKSTVLPGTTQLMQERFPQHRFIFNPEFLREATAYDDFINPDRQIVGATAAAAAEAPAVMAMLPRAPFELICGAAEAEMAKYVANSFLAVKVSYANEVFDLCGRLGIDYARVRDIAAADPRIGHSHLDVFDAGYRGYGGKCLPKDSKSLLDLALDAGLDMHVLRAADRTNELLRAAAPPPPVRIELSALESHPAERAA